MSMQRTRWIPRAGDLAPISVALVTASLLNGCIFFGTEFCDLETDPSCVGGSGATGIGEGGADGSGGQGAGASSSGGVGESSGGSAAGGTGGEIGASGGSTGGTGGTGGSTGGAESTGGTSGSTGGAESTGGSGGGTGALERLWINETRVGSGSSWVELYNAGALPIDLSEAWLSSSGSASPDYSNACSLASAGSLAAGSFLIVAQHSPPTCAGAPAPCVKGCLGVQSGAGRFIQIFEGTTGDLTLINARELKSPGPGSTETYQSPSDGQEGDFVTGEPSPGMSNSP